MDVRQHTRPLLKLPGEDLAFGLWLYPRSVAVDDETGYRSLTEANEWDKLAPWSSRSSRERPRII